MKRVRVETDPAYEIRIGSRLLEELAADLAGKGKLALLADARAHGLHGARLLGLETVPRRLVPPGEESKSLAELGSTLEFLARAELDRRSCLVVFGGGMAGDLGGLAASLFKRGIAVVHVPTTLLAQVDSSIGGKTAINLASGKNLAGTVHQPRAVYSDTGVLATLPPEEWLSGLGEVVKTALVGGDALLGEVEARAAALLAREPAACEALVEGCARVKARVVAEDPRENGPRRALNLGHTFAHAIEHAAGYGTIPHGVAVGVGLCLALEASREQELLEEASLQERVRALLESLGLPTTLGMLRERFGTPLRATDLLRGLAHDKKGAVGAPELVLVRGAGKLELGVRTAPAALERVLARG
jgi:3-dehydroquinate synthetase